jgi:SAM-dependent methyltransferase
MMLIYERPERFASDEGQRAKEYWRSAGLQPGYLEPTRWSRYMAERALELQPARVLEFGCHCGRNLSAIRSRDPRIELVGIDVNPAAVRHGRRVRALDLRLGDERSLGEIPDREFDVAFTVSVLDHIPDPRPVLADLIRVARRGVFLLEPWSARPGKVVAEIDERSGEERAVDSYLYWWDYPRLIAELAPGRLGQCQPYDLGGSGMRRWLSSKYWLFGVRLDSRRSVAQKPLKAGDRG